MTNMTKHWLNRIRQLCFSVSLCAAASIFASTGSAQSSSQIRQHYPQLADLFNAFDVSQAKAFEEMAAINSNPATQEARNALQMNLNRLARMSMSEMMAAGMGHGGEMGMSDGPYRDLEREARVSLLQQMRGKHTDEVANAAFENSSAIDRHTAAVLRRGRNFEESLFSIYIDDSVPDKKAAVTAAIEDYLSDEQLSVATVPKESNYLIEHNQASGFKSAFPLLSGFLWTQQWLQLAALEAVILEGLDSQFAGGVTVALERFWKKLGSAGGMTMFPAPSELPMAPAIAPDLYSQSPQAAIIIDNLNVLETAIADILSFPNVENRDELINQAVALFTNKENDNAETMDYLLFALRGGIYNQGGPAVGELMQSERNRTRAAMDMQHNMIMSSPQ